MSGSKSRVLMKPKKTQTLSLAKEQPSWKQFQYYSNWALELTHLDSEFFCKKDLWETYLLLEMDSKNGSDFVDRKILLVRFKDLEAVWSRSPHCGLVEIIHTLHSTVTCHWTDCTIFRTSCSRNSVIWMVALKKQKDSAMVSGDVLLCSLRVLRNGWLAGGKWIVCL